jgi:hypothetical protein
MARDHRLLTLQVEDKHILLDYAVSLLPRNNPHLIILIL